MNRVWPRAIALGLAVIAGALLLKGAHPLVVLAVFAGVFVALSVRLKRSARSAAAPTGAELAGLQRATVDPFGILGYPLLLLSRTEAPAIDEVSWGRWRAARRARVRALVRRARGARSSRPSGRSSRAR